MFMKMQHEHNWAFTDSHSDLNQLWEGVSVSFTEGLAH